MTGESLSFEIYPEDVFIPLSLLEKTIEDIRRLVRDVDYAVTRERIGRSWVVTRLQSSVPTVSIRPAFDGQRVVEALADGLRIVTQGQAVEPPPHFSADVLDDLKRMRRLFTGRQRARRVVFSSDGMSIATIDQEISEQVDRILRGTYTVLGSLEGMLDAINLHKAPTFTIWDRVSGSPVRCMFPKEAAWIEQVKTLLQKRVLVSGHVNYFRNGAPRSISRVREVRDMTPDSTLPKADFGSVLDEQAKRDPVKYIKTRRE